MSGEQGVHLNYCSLSLFVDTVGAQRYTLWGYRVESVSIYFETLTVTGGYEFGCSH